MPVQRQLPVAPGTYGEGRESSIASACRDRDAVAMPVVRTTQPANDTKRRDYRQRTKDHRARGLADQQTSGHELRAVGHEWDRPEAGTAPVEQCGKHWIAEIVEGGICDKQRAGEENPAASQEQNR